MTEDCKIPPGQAPTRDSIQDAPTFQPVSLQNSYAQSAPPAAESLSKFDPSLYRRANSVRMDESVIATRKIQTVIPVRKPSKKQFVSVHPSPDFRAENMPTIEDETTGEIYLLAAQLDFSG